MQLGTCESPLRFSTSQVGGNYKQKVPRQRFPPTTSFPLDGRNRPHTTRNIGLQLSIMCPNTDQVLGVFYFTESTAYCNFIWGNGVGAIRVHRMD